MQPFHRKPPTKKRHTKPCRFFQIGNCSFSAEDCDFAHILPNEVNVQSSRPCRYYAAGRCDNGLSCRFKHLLGRFEVESPDDIKVSGERDTIKLACTCNIHESPRMQNMITASGDEVSPVDNIYPFPDPWQKSYLNGVMFPSYQSCPLPHLYYPEYYSPPHSTDSSAGPSGSAPSSLSDEVAFVTEDPKYSEHYHQHQSQICIVEEQPIIHVPPFYHSPPPAVPVLTLDTSYHTLSNLYGSYNVPQLPSPNQTTKTRAQVRTVSRHPKVIKYKTKPCKFYRTAEGCPNGSDCTFIHDETSPIYSPSTSDSKTSPILPSKPLSKVEENKKKNFFPISWRVIGGGVLMGDPKSSSTTQDPPEPGFIQDDTSPQDLESKHCRSSSPSKPVVRARSSSNPPAPNLTQIKSNMRLFSAESPGNL